MRAAIFAVAVVAVIAVALYALAAAGNIFLAFARPPQPLRLGTVQWFDEVGATVDRVDRVAQIGNGPHARRARGQFYIVHARIIAPFGFRPYWHDSDVQVHTFSGRNGTMPKTRFPVDAAAQAMLDRETGRPGPDHLVRGAAQHEDLVFDLPVDVEQPALVFLPANDPIGLLDVLFGHFWQPHRFNLRYD
ncbi:MAG: hypothetical protein JOY59_13135 [Candidatus Eremiobacteraeota bacterium]|nr:hypothetical protein [Candidatus Eremiobacteraeota bacterium]